MSQETASPTLSCKISRKRKISLQKRLDDLLRANPGYQLLQHNGQRIFLPCSDLGANQPLPRGCEVFVGNLPKNMYEDELVPLFQSVGPVFKFRLMLDFHVKSRGYAFATYYSPWHAKEAIDKLNGFRLPNGPQIGVFKSVDNRRLFVGNIPRDRTRDDVYCLFHRHVEGLTDVIMYPSLMDKRLNRGFAFIEFESHAFASVARRQFYPRNIVAWDCPLFVDWAAPLPEVDPHVMATISILYVKNLPINLDNDAIFALFRDICGPGLIKKISKTLNYAFVHCKNRMGAEIVMQKLMGFMIEDDYLEVEWARPREYAPRVQSRQIPDNFCLSVPLRCRKAIREFVMTRKTSLESASKSSSYSSSPDNYSLDNLILDQQ